MTVFGLAFEEAREAERRRPRKHRTPAAVVIGRTAGQLVGRVSRRISRTAVLVTSGLGLIDYGIWQYNEPAGFIAAGVSLLIIDLAAGGER